MNFEIAFITRNRKNELYRAIKSCTDLLGNSTNFIIVDNGSTDGTKNYVMDSFKECSIVYHYSENNLGVAGGRNKAFSLSKEKYIFFLDDDAIVASKNFFEVMINYMEKNENIVALSPNIIEPKTNTNLNSTHYYFENNQKNILSFCGCAHILRTSFYKEIGFLYPENLQFGSEELYASLIGFLHNKRIVELDSITVEHYPSTINRVLGDDRKLNFILNQYIIKKMLYPKSKLFLCYIFYKFHLIKNKLNGRKWRKFANEMYKDRYNAKYINRMNNKKWYFLVKKYGWRVSI